MFPFKDKRFHNEKIAENIRSKSDRFCSQILV